MRQLTDAEIEQFASRPGVRRIAVENFLGSLGHAGSEVLELVNMRRDAEEYRWTWPTQIAIASGIHLAYKEVKE